MSFEVGGDIDYYLNAEKAEGEGSGVLVWDAYDSGFSEGDFNFLSNHTISSGTNYGSMVSNATNAPTWCAEPDAIDPNPARGWQVNSVKAVIIGNFTNQ